MNKSPERILVLTKVEDGNTSDKTWNLAFIKKMRETLNDHDWSNLLYQADSAMITKENLRELAGDELDFLSRSNLWHESDLENGRNVLLLFDGKGIWDAYTTYDLDRANVNWTEDGLYLSDYKYEYFISNEGEIKRAEKTTELREGTAQDGSSIDEEGGVWSWFDIGFRENSYETLVTYRYKGERMETIVEGVYSYLFTVGTQLYGGTSSFDLPHGINKGGHLGLVKFVGDDLTPMVLASYPLPDKDVDPVFISQQVVLVEDTIHVIGEAERIGHVFQTNLMKWNIHDGAFELDRIAIPTDHYGDELVKHVLLSYRSKST